MKKIYFLFLLITGIWITAQTPDEKKIDLLLEQSLKEYAEMKLIPSLSSAKKAFLLSTQNQYDKGICKANVDIANVLLTIGMYKDGLIYLEKAADTKFYASESSMQAELCRLRGRAYTSLKMYDLSLKEYRKQLKISETIQDPDLKNMSVLFTHENLVTTFNLMNLKDSAFTHIAAQEKILKDHFKEDKDFYYFSTLYYQYGEYYLHQKKYDLAEQYLNRSYTLLKKNNAPFLYTTLQTYAELEKGKGNREKTISYYKQALQNAVEIGSKESEMYLYKELANYYMDNDLNQKEANMYLHHYQKLNDSLDVKNKELSQLAFAQIMTQKENENTSKNTRYIYLIILAAVLLLIVALFWYQWHLKNKKLIDTNKKTLSEMSQATVVLERKIEENKFNDLIALAKSNNPEFLILFSELYPHFIQRLKAIDPKIRSSELSFCAMAYLNFSSKDIATYTYVTLGAVEMRRSRLRKKYNIPSEIDFNNWMRREG